MLVQDGTIKERINWIGVLAGLVTGIVTELALILLGVAIGAATIDTASGLAWSTIIWLAVSVAISAWLAGLVAARSAGYLTPAQGRFNGLITGMLLALASTLLISNALTSGVRAAVGLASGAASAASAAGSAAANSGALQSDPVQSILSGLNPSNIAQIVAQNSPNLNERQATAATNVITNIVSRASNDIGNNLSNISNLGDIVTNRVKSIQAALTGPQFVSRLQGAGLSQASAQATATAIGEQVNQLQQQATQTAQAAANIARKTASTAGWSALLALGLILGFATLGGGMGNDVPKNGATMLPNLDENARRDGRA